MGTGESCAGLAGCEKWVEVRMRVRVPGMGPMAACIPMSPACCLLTCCRFACSCPRCAAEMDPANEQAVGLMQVGGGGSMADLS
jgi:hypothetical protein